MPNYAIGDLQGCLDPLQELLQRIAFDPIRDRLLFAGDLVNRGPQSLQVLRFIRSLGKAAVTVLGNHDLHLLAATHGGRFRANDTFDEIMRAPDRDELLDWLMQQPLAHEDPQSGALLIHAGVPPQWDRAQVLSLAQEVSATLTGPGGGELLTQMYGNEPDRWSEGLRGLPRLRFIINCLTRLRYCESDGRVRLKPSGAPGTQPQGLLPWFEAPGRKTAGDTIVFGHWSTLGRVHWPQARVYGLDTGCLWGGCLTALNLESWATTSIDCRQYQQPSVHDG
jgi:bis(5'-nucleosyl)-tetraphosphatase (symmetrical)